MTFQRIVWKLPAIVLTSTLAAGWLLVVRAIAWCVPRGRVARENRVIRTWARTMTRIVGMRVQASGPAPKSSFLLVSNHLSYVDVLAYMSLVDARLLSKAEVGRWPFIGPLARLGGTLFVDRSQRRDVPRVIGEIKETLATGRGVVFFPEGTSSSGMEVMGFKASLFEVAVQGNLEVCTAAIRYECRPGERPAQWSVSWWGNMPFAPHFLGMLRLSGFNAFITFNAERVRGTDRKQLASEARACVEAVFEPVCHVLGPDALFGDEA